MVVVVVVVVVLLLMMVVVVMMVAVSDEMMMWVYPKNICINILIVDSISIAAIKLACQSFTYYYPIQRTVYPIRTLVG